MNEYYCPTQPYAILTYQVRCFTNLLYRYSKCQSSFFYIFIFLVNINIDNQIRDHGVHVIAQGMLINTSIKYLDISGMFFLFEGTFITIFNSVLDNPYGMKGTIALAQALSINRSCTLSWSISIFYTIYDLPSV